MGMEREPGFRWPATDETYAPQPFKPAQYVACRTVDAIQVDGDLSESSWANAEWTALFDHIFLPGYKRPFLATRAKLVWDDTHLYAACELEEPNLVGHVTTKDEEIYRDNDIELFLDVDGDGQDYIELEFNCLGTIWDMLFAKEYNRGVPRSHPRIDDSPPWDLEGMRVAVRMDGSLNYPLDVDRGWRIEIALPWASLQATSRDTAPLNRPGTVLRANFSRVQHSWPKVWPIVDWQDRGDASYDWTWSRNLVYNMHSVECWGRVLLSARTVVQAPDPRLDAAFGFVPAPAPDVDVSTTEMVRIAAGRYPIGPDPLDPDDSPAGHIELAAFDLDAHPVTVAAFAAFLNAGDHGEHYQPDMANPDWCGIVEAAGAFAVVPGRDRYPVTLLTVEAARAFAAWAGKRLPTEHEWEAAARGVDGRRYPWGEAPVDDTRANHDYRVGHPTPVGCYPAGRTPEGVWDLAGNVWEYCEGRWRAYAWDGEPDAPHAPRTAGQLVRGGAWTLPAAHLAAAYRNGAKGGFCPMVGLRCARDAPAGYSTSE